MLAEFSEKQKIPYPLLSDVDSEVIRAFGILNDTVEPGDAMLYGIPYPGTYVCDEAGVVVAKFFHESYKKRDSAELYIDAALGRVVLDEAAPSVSHGDEDVQVTVAVQGGSGSLRQGIVRQAIVRFDLADGLHLYGPPAPEGMIPLAVTLKGPPGLVAEAAELPPTETLHLADMGIDLEVWSGSFEVRVPFYAVGELASETRPLDVDSVILEVQARFQACDDNTCLLPRTESLSLELPLEAIDVPNIDLHTGHGQREGAYDGTPHLRRLLLRKIRQHPLGFLRYLRKHRRLIKEAKARRAD